MKTRADGYGEVSSIEFEMGDVVFFRKLMPDERMHRNRCLELRGTFGKPILEHVGSWHGRLVGSTNCWEMCDTGGFGVRIIGLRGYMGEALAPGKRVWGYEFETLEKNDA